MDRSALGTERQQQWRSLARRARLRYVRDADPGIARRSNGHGFFYLTPAGRVLRSVRTLERIQSLAIPPAWTDVWICRFENGHLQSTGRDARRRKQYRYHAQWSETVAQEKFDRLLGLAGRLPGLRDQVQRDLRRRGLPKRKVVALLVHLLDVTAIRIGNREYARDNESYGLTTLRDEHVHIAGGRIVFDFVGKSGQVQHVELRDRRLARLIRRCRSIPGANLFQYDDGKGHVTSADVNIYLQELSDGEITAKDFRMWRASACACELLAAGPPIESVIRRKRFCNEALRAVAVRLGNTLAVCRRHYVHRAIIESWLSGELRSVARGFRLRPGGLARDEQLLVHVLRRLSRRRSGAEAP